MVPRKTASFPESSPSNSESSLLGKVPRKTTPVLKKLPSEQDEAQKEEPEVGSSSSSLQRADTDTPARFSWGIVPKTDGMASPLPWGYAGKTESTSPGTSSGSKTKNIQADRFGGEDRRWGLKTADTPIPLSSGEQLGKIGGCRADPEPVTLVTEAAGTLASKISDTPTLSTSVKVDPGEVARSSALQNDSSWDSSTATPQAASPEARYSDDSRPASTERESRPSYPSASREGANYSVYPAAFVHINGRSSYRSVRPA
jgi:hypothetical protein